MFNASILQNDVAQNIVYLETSELAGAVYDLDDYKKHAIWKLRIVADDLRIFIDAGQWLYFKEATVLLRRFKTSGVCCKDCIHIIGHLMGTINFLRDFVIVNDMRRSCIYTCSDDVGVEELTDAVAKLRRNVRHPGSDFMQMMANALAVSVWDNGLFYLFGIMQVKYYQLRENVDEIMALKKQEGEMN